MMNDAEKPCISKISNETICKHSLSPWLIINVLEQISKRGGICTKEDGDLLFECSEWKWFHDASTLVEQRKVIRCTVEGKEDSVFYRVYDPILGSSDTPYLCFMHYCSCHDFHQSNEGFPFCHHLVAVHYAKAFQRLQSRYISQEQYHSVMTLLPT